MLGTGELWGDERSMISLFFNYVGLGGGDGWRRGCWGHAVENGRVVVSMI